MQVDHWLEGPRDGSNQQQNISRTTSLPATRETARGDRSGRRGEPDPSRTCSYIADPHWRFGDGDPFCGAPAEPGHPYCARHRQLCQLTLDSDAERAELAAQARDAELLRGPPTVLKHLRSVPPPEPLPVDEAELRSLLDHPPPRDIAPD
jgi:hypothetical protein